MIEPARENTFEHFPRDPIVVIDTSAVSPLLHMTGREDVDSQILGIHTKNTYHLIGALEERNNWVTVKGVVRELDGGGNIKTYLKAKNFGAASASARNAYYNARQEMKRVVNSRVCETSDFGEDFDKNRELWLPYVREEFRKADGKTNDFETDVHVINEAICHAVTIGYKHISDKNDITKKVGVWTRDNAMRNTISILKHKYGIHNIFLMDRHGYRIDESKERRFIGGLC